jgi:hypothetical protein
MDCVLPLRNSGFTATLTSLPTVFPETSSRIGKTNSQLFREQLYFLQLLCDVLSLVFRTVPILFTAAWPIERFVHLFFVEGIPAQTNETSVTLIANS